MITSFSRNAILAMIFASGVVVTGAGYIFKQQAAAAPAGQASSNATPASVVAVIDGRSISESEVTAGGLNGAVSRAQVIDDYVNKVLMSNDFEKRLSAAPDVIAKIERARREILAEAWAMSQSQSIRSGLKDEALQDTYTKEISDSLFAKYKLSFTISQTADEGADAKPQKWESLKTNKGEEWISIDAIPYQMGPIVKSMKKGDFTKTPITVREGYLRIRVDDIQDGKKPTFEEMKPRITEVLVARGMQNKLQALRGGADIRIK